MVKINNGIKDFVQYHFNDLDFEIMYQSNINQLTFYIDSELNNKEFSRLKTIVAKYIGDNLLTDSYSTIKFFK